MKLKPWHMGYVQQRANIKLKFQTYVYKDTKVVSDQKLKVMNTYAWKKNIMR